MLELELLLNPFLDHVYPALSPKLQQNFIDLLEFPDPDLYNFLMGSEIPDTQFQIIVTKIRDYHHHQS